MIPALNEQDNIGPIAARLFAALKSENIELIFVDDGSTDATSSKISQLNEQDPRVKLVSLSRNFGHQFALSAGLDYADGDAIVFMDADLQHPPEIVPQLLARWRDGFEVVHTLREETSPAPFFKRLSSALFYRVFALFTGIKTPRNVADFRLIDKKVAQALRDCRERSRFLRGLVLWAGYRACFISYQAEARKRGDTKFTLRRMCRLAADGILSFSTLPLYFSLIAGIGMCSFGFLYGAYSLWVKFALNQNVPGWTSLMIVTCLFSGFQILALGLQGMYIGKIFEETKARPLYLVREIRGFSRPEK